MVATDATLHDLSQSQDAIGWDQLMKGRFSNLWNEQSLLASQRTQKTNWTVEVIDCIFQHWWELWELRNQDRHGRDKLTRAQALTLQAHRELHLMYEKYQPIAPQHLQWLFDIDITMRQQWPTHKLWQWIHTWLPALDANTNPQWAPTNPENYPFQTELKTG